MLNEISRYIESHQLLTKDRPVVVGLSGGADSVALLLALCDLGYPCLAAHCNFHLRDAESDRDEVFARLLTESQGVPFYKTDFDTKTYAARNGISVEMAARELRYQWFEQLRVEQNAQAIAVAHHEQDNVETVLLNLIRGTGIKGLGGMSPKNGYVVRPLLSVKKTTILTWLEQREQEYVVDSTNLSDEYTRNFLRLRVIPLLEELNPSVTEAIARTAENLSDAEQLYSYALNEISKQVLVGDYCIRIEALLQMPAPKTVLYELLKPYGFNRSVVNDLFQTLRGESGRRFYSTEFLVLKDRDCLLISPLSEQTSEDDVYLIDPDEVEIQTPVHLSFRKEEIKSGFNISRAINNATFDADKLKFPLSLRRWREGDWFIPFGMTGKKKLSDYFTNRKLSLIDKEQIWLLCSGENIIWIIGERIDNRFCIDENSKQALIIDYFKTTQEVI